MLFCVPSVIIFEVEDAEWEDAIKIKSMEVSSSHFATLRKNLQEVRSLKTQ